jgi:murein DD-endopeptidase MepM/ murein hydrolase activator NlpD
VRVMATVTGPVTAPASVLTRTRTASGMAVANLDTQQTSRMAMATAPGLDVQKGMRMDTGGVPKGPWASPLRPMNIPDFRGPGAFAAVRKFDIHTGVDLYAAQGATVYAVEAGTVIAVEKFTGPSAGTPWWLDTQAVLVAGDSGVVVYGEIEPSVQVGDVVQAGAVIGAVKQVLRQDKGVTPVCMLHLELLDHGATESAPVWALGAPAPAGLLDPTEHLIAVKGRSYR